MVFEDQCELALDFQTCSLSCSIYKSNLFLNFSVDCILAVWSEWSQCSTDCFYGKQTRDRKVLQEATSNGTQCNGEKNQTRNCYTECCKKIYYSIEFFFSSFFDRAIPLCCFKVASNIRLPTK